MASAPFLVPIDLNNLEIQNVKLQNISSGDPTTGVGEGSIFIDTSLHRPKWHNGTEFKQIYPFDTTNSNSTGVLRDGSGNFAANVITANSFSGSLSGNATTATSLAGGDAGKLPYQSAAGTTGFTAAGSSGQVLLSGGTGSPTWSNQSSLSVGSATSATTASACTGNSATVTVTQDQFLVGNASNVGASTAKSSIPLSGFGNAAADLNLGGFAITNSAVTDNSSADSTLATCGYVRAVAQSLDVKGSVKVATTANLTSLSGLFTLNGVTLLGNYRVLVKDQTDKKENGIYLAQTGAWTRADDMDSASEVPGAFTFVEGGTTFASTGWVATATVTGLIGTFDITWTQFSGAGTYTANRGLVQNGTAFNFAQDSDYTAGRIPFAGATDALGTASTKIGFNSNFVWDNGNSRLGIGTASPGTALDVNGSVTLRGGNYLFLNNSANDSLSVIYNNGASGAGTIQFNTGGSEKMRLDVAGNLGLGVAPNAWGTGYKAIQLSGQGVSIFGSTATSYAGLTSNGFYNGSNWAYNNSAPAGLYIINQNSHVWYNAPSGSAGATQSVTQGQYYTVTTTGDTVLVDWQKRFSELTSLPSVGQTIYCTSTGTLLGTATVTQIVTFSTRMILDASGKLGIGTATPDNLLSVRKETSSGIAVIDIRGGSSGAGAVQISGNATTLGTTSFDLIQNSSGSYVLQRDNNPLYISTNNTTRLTIASDGVFTWSNVGGVANTAMTLNSTGLGIGNAPELKLRADGPDEAPATSGSSATNGTFRISAQGASTNLSCDFGVNTTGSVYSWIQSRSRANYASNFSLVLNPNGGNVGIGVASPSYKLDVNSGQIRVVESGTGSGDGGLIAATASANGNAGVLLQTNGVSRWNLTTSGTNGANFRIYNYTLGSSVATFDSSGNVGIGVTPSAWGNAFRAIQMGSGTTTASFIAQTNSPVARIMTNSYYDGANFVKVSNNTAGMYVIQNNAHEWHTAGTGTGNFSFTQAMTLDASGNLGVGTSPAYNKLHIAGSNSTDGPTNFLCVLDNTASPVSGVGTGIAFKTNVGTFRAILGVVEAVKENSTSDNYASALKFSTRTNGSDLATRLTISSAGVATFSGTVTVKSNSGSGTGYAPAIYNATLSGDGSTTAFTVTHNFSNPKPIVQVWQKGSPYGLVYADITSNSTGTTTTITFATAPASGTDYWVTVLG
jgi:hypothetical protein